MTTNSQKVLEWRAANPDKYRKTERQAREPYRLGPRHTGMVRSAVLLAALALAFSACSNGSEGQASEDIATLELPYGSGVEVGETYDYVLYVHCGVRLARLDGVWWETDLFADSDKNPPDGWGDPFDEGTMTILDERTADYVDGHEMTVRFERTDFVDAPFSPCF